MTIISFLHYYYSSDETFIDEVKQSLCTFQMQWVILINGKFEFLVISAPELVGDSEDDSEDDEDSSALVKCINILKFN